LPEADIRHAAGVPIKGGDESGIAAALALCDEADVVIACVGEEAVMSGEAASRSDLDLPGLQRDFLEAVFARAHGKPVIVVIFSGRPLVVPWLVGKADAVLAAWFLGSEAGSAIADVVTGRVSPSGRTPITWPRALGQVPIFFGERPSGRPDDREDKYTSKYLDVPNAPLFPFGHGLTYGRFGLSNLHVGPARVAERDTIEIAVDVTNSGALAAEETVFLVVHDKVACVARPVLELKGFGKIALKPGESGTVRMQLPAADLKFLGIDLQLIFEPGEVEILVGPCADRSRLLAASIELLEG
jgi:beta-glucosidase